VNKQIQVDFVLVETWDLRSPNPGRVTIRSQSTDLIRAEKANNWNWKSLILTWNVDDWYPDVRIFISLLKHLKNMDSLGYKISIYLFSLKFLVFVLLFSAFCPYPIGTIKRRAILFIKKYMLVAVIPLL
jgi:hypothetical protein